MPLSLSWERRIPVSPAQFARSAHARFRSSSHSVYASSSLFAGSIDTRFLICPRISSSVPAKSTRPASSPWKSADAVSHLDTWFPSSAFGEFTKSFPFLDSMNVKSVIAGMSAIPPPQVPNTAVICGITPDAIACAI